MSLQTRLSALITAIGADIKSLNTGKVNKSGDAMTGTLTVVTAVGNSDALPKGQADGLYVRKNVDIIDGGTP